jgi:tetratricopeptide (TPR) repeat protein
MLKDDIETTRITVIDMQGTIVEDDLGKLCLYLPSKYSFLEMAMGVARGEFDCRSFHEGKIKQERRFVDFTDKKPTIRAFYGRGPEIRRLNEFLASDQARVMIVQGIAGIGKTTLLAKFVQDVRDRINVFWFKLHEWVNLKGLLRPLGEFLSQVGKKGLEWYLTQSEAPQIVEVCHILESDLRDVNSLWIIDDVQKADKGINDLLSAFVGVLENMKGVKMVCSSREVPSFYPRSSVVSGLVEELGLEGLDKESSITLMRERSLPVSTLDQIYQVTKGHPLFMELVEDPHMALGKNIRMFVEQEVYSKLDLSERRILEIASVFRYPVPTDSFFIMEEEISKAGGQLQRERSYADYMVDYDTIDVLLRKALLQESTGRMVGMHDVLREFFYSRLSPRERIIFHWAAANYYLRDTGAPSYVEALYHGILANECDISIRIAAGNGRDIISKGYANLFQPLLGELLQKCPRMALTDRMEMLLLQAEILDIQGDWDRALVGYHEIVHLSSPEKDRRLIAEVDRRIGVIHLRKIAYDEALIYLRQSLDIADSIQDEHTLTQVLYDLGGIHERKGDSIEALQSFRRSGQMARSIGDQTSLGRALYGEGRVESQMRNLDRAIPLKKEALQVLERTGDINEIAKVRISLAGDLSYQGLYEEAVCNLEEAVGMLGPIGRLDTLGYAMSNLSVYYLEIGQLEKAEAAIDRAMQIGQKLNERFIIAAAHLNRGYLYHKRGEWEWAKESFRTSVDMLRATGAHLRLSLWLYEIGKVYLENGDKEGGKRLLQEALEIAQKSGQETLCHQVEETMLSIGT